MPVCFRVKLRMAVFVKLCMGESISTHALNQIRDDSTGHSVAIVVVQSQSAHLPALSAKDTLTCLRSDWLAGADLHWALSEIQVKPCLRLMHPWRELQSLIKMQWIDCRWALCRSLWRMVQIGTTFWRKMLTFGRDRGASRRFDNTVPTGLWLQTLGWDKKPFKFIKEKQL